MLWTTAFQKLLATRSDRIVTTVTAILLVLLGYMLGLWTATIQKPTPMVFQTTAEDEGPLSNADLAALTQTPSPSAEKPTIATTGATNASGTPDDTSAAAPAQTGAFLASSGGSKYYYPTCAELKRIKPENIISFASEQEAKNAGYDPSACVLKRKK